MPPASATCQISVRGSLDPLWEDYLGDMLLHADVEAGQVRTTLVGKPRDLAAFIGALSLLADLGFPVIECEYHRIDPGQESASPEVAQKSQCQ